MLERAASAGQLGQRVVVRQARQRRVGDRVGADLHAGTLQRVQLAPCEEAAVAAGDPRGDDVRRRPHVQAGEHGHGVGEDIAVAVVEREHDRLARQPAAAHQRREQLPLRDGAIAVPSKPAHLPVEVGRVDGERACDRRRGGSGDADQVVHQGRDDARAAGQPGGQLEPALLADGGSRDRWARHDEGCRAAGRVRHPPGGGGGRGRGVASSGADRGRDHGNAGERGAAAKRAVRCGVGHGRTVGGPANVSLTARQPAANAPCSAHRPAGRTPSWSSGSSARSR
jgi:hypothetical protein